MFFYLCSKLEHFHWREPSAHLPSDPSSSVMFGSCCGSEDLHLALCAPLFTLYFFYILIRGCFYEYAPPRDFPQGRRGEGESYNGRSSALFISCLEACLLSFFFYCFPKLMLFFILVDQMSSIHMGKSCVCELCAGCLSCQYNGQLC